MHGLEWDTPATCPLFCSLLIRRFFLLVENPLAYQTVSQIIPKEVYAILDTCVLVSALRSKDGASHLVLRAVLAGKIRLALSVALAIEYEEVCLRPGLIPHLDSAQIIKIVDGLCHLSQHQKIFYTWRPFLSDPDDDLVLELALSAGAPFIITQNLKDFKGAETLGVRIITPAQSLTLI